MSGFWWRPLLLAWLLGWAATALWYWASPQAALWLAVVTLGLLWLHSWRNLYRLDRWLHHPDPLHLPEARGAWSRIFDDLYGMVRAQSRSQHQLTQALERFQQAAQAIPDGVLLLDGQGRIEWCNPVAEGHFGIGNEADRGVPLTYLVRNQQFVEYLRGDEHGEAFIYRPAGRDLTLSVQPVPYGEKQLLLMSHDITQLERVETMRRDFIANVSHELRTPLTVVAGFLETLEDGGNLDDETARHAHRLMADQTRRMQRLVDDLLMLSRLESAQNPVQEESVAVDRLLRELAGDAASLSRGRHAVRCEIETGAGLRGNEAELRSAFGNLVSNAVRYTPEGGEIVLRWEKGENGGACFSVSDTGIGIAAEHIPRLVERFYRVDRSRSRETGGTGLGLSIVRHVLGRHQAQLDIDSQPGQGSRFSARFPAARLLERPAGE